MADKKDDEPKIKGFGMASAFVVLLDNGQAEVKALKPTEEEIVELTKFWHDEKQKQDQEDK